MKVIATEKGYYGRLIEPGETFEVPDGEKATWFNPVDGSPKEKASKGGKQAAAPVGADSADPAAV